MEKSKISDLLKENIELTNQNKKLQQENDKLTNQNNELRNKSLEEFKKTAEIIGYNIKETVIGLLFEEQRRYIRENIKGFQENTSETIKPLSQIIIEIQEQNRIIQELNQELKEYG